MQTMIELTVMFDNPSIPPKVLLTGPYDNVTGSCLVLDAIDELRKQAEEELEGAVLKDEQCFYRFFRR